jgi:hypothetical protein
MRVAFVWSIGCVSFFSARKASKADVTGRKKAALVSNCLPDLLLSGNNSLPHAQQLPQIFETSARTYVALDSAVDTPVNCLPGVVYVYIYIYMYNYVP